METKETSNTGAAPTGTTEIVEVTTEAAGAELATTTRSFAAAVRVDLFGADLATVKTEGKKIAVDTVKNEKAAGAGYWNLIALAARSRTLTRAGAAPNTAEAKATTQDEFLGLCSSQDFLDELGYDKVNATIATSANAPAGMQTAYRAALTLENFIASGGIVDDQFWTEYAKASRYTALEVIARITKEITTRNKIDKDAKASYEGRTLSGVLVAVILAFNNFAAALKADDIATTPGLLALPAPGSGVEKVTNEKAAKKAKAEAEKAEKKAATEKAKAAAKAAVLTPNAGAEAGAEDKYEKEHAAGTRDEDAKRGLTAALQYLAGPVTEQTPADIAKAIIAAMDEYRGQTVIAYDILRTAARMTDTHNPQTMIGAEEVRTTAELMIESAKEEAARILEFAQKVKAGAEEIAEATIAEAEAKAANIATTKKAAKKTTTKATT